MKQSKTVGEVIRDKARAMRAGPPPSEPPVCPMTSGPVTTAEANAAGIVLPATKRQAPQSLREHCHRLATKLHARADERRRAILIDQTDDPGAIAMVIDLEMAAKTVLSWSGRV